MSDSLWAGKWASIENMFESGGNIMAGEETSLVENQQDSSAPRHAMRSSNNPAPTIAHSTDEGEPGWGGTYQGYSAVDKKPRTSPRSGEERRKHHTMVEKFKVRIEGYGVTQRVTRVNSKEILRENLFTKIQSVGGCNSSLDKPV